jgi:hypothetical protein
MPKTVGRPPQSTPQFIEVAALQKCLTAAGHLSMIKKRYD